jgi:sulfur carrier protein ThiS
MRIRVKLMGLLKAITPEGGALDVADAATVDDVLRALAVAPAPNAVIAVNGQIERDRTRALAADDELTVIPPVGGG